MLSSELVAGQVAEWSCSGLQSRVRRFDSDPGLQKETALPREATGPRPCCLLQSQTERSVVNEGVALVQSAFERYGQKPPSIA
jgi:hypothetical protein